MNDIIEKTGVLEGKEKKDKIENKLYHTKEITELMNKVAEDYVEQVALMKDEEIAYDRGAWMAEFGYNNHDEWKKDEGYDIDIHTLAILIEQLRRFGRIWYDIKHSNHIFDGKNKSK